MLWDAGTEFQRAYAQNAFQCCGWQVYNFTAPPGTTGAVSGVAAQPCPARSVQQACAQVIVPAIRKRYTLFGGTVIGVAVAQIAAIVVTAWLLFRLRRAAQSEPGANNVNLSTLSVADLRLAMRDEK